MTLDEIKVVGIAGAGTMGASMAQIFAQYGYTVIIYDAFEAGLERGKHLVEINQASLVEAGDITAEQSAEIKTKLSLQAISMILKTAISSLNPFLKDLTLNRISG